jgi:Pentapeptide repeats (8 copies)
VQAALTVLARRPDRAELRPIDLRRCDLRLAFLHGAKFRRAILSDSWLDYADLGEVDLREASLRQIGLAHTWIRLAHTWMRAARQELPHEIGEHLRRTIVYGGVGLRQRLQRRTSGALCVTAGTQSRPWGSLYAGSVNALVRMSRRPRS